MDTEQNKAKTAATGPRTVLSGITPSGRPHIGNYFGAMKQFVDLQNAGHNLFVMVADLHALTKPQTHSGDVLRSFTYDLMLDYLAIGLDPAKITLFKQSDVPAHTELAWILNCLTTMPYLMRAHAFKDAEAKNKDTNVGLFCYPTLMAADILLYQPDLVPVGSDQKQHIEITRDLAEKFNHTFSTVFKMPEPLIQENVATVPGIDGQKMSKSYGNTIPLFASDEEISKLCMSIVTDSSGEIPKNVYEIHKLFRTEAELAELYAAKKGKYKDLKEALATDIKTFVAPLRARRAELAQNPNLVHELLAKGAVAANVVAQKTMAQVRQVVGLTQ